MFARGKEVHITPVCHVWSRPHIWTKRKSPFFNQCLLTLYTVLKDFGRWGMTVMYADIFTLIISWVFLFEVTASVFSYSNLSHMYTLYELIPWYCSVKVTGQLQNPWLMILPWHYQLNNNVTYILVWLLSGNMLRMHVLCHVPCLYCDFCSTACSNNAFPSFSF